MNYDEMTDEQKLKLGFRFIRKILHNYDGRMRNGEIPRAFPGYDYWLVTRILDFMKKQGWCYSYSDTWHEWYIVR